MSFFSDRTYLVTGGTGFIGSALVRALVKCGARVRSLDDDWRGSRERLGEMASDTDLITGDIRDQQAFADAVQGSWGVIHHSANPLRILQEMRRILKPGGRAMVMVYHRSLWRYYVVDGFIKGILRGDLFRRHSLLSVNQAETDGALARYYRPEEWRSLCKTLFRIEKILITGQKSDVIPFHFEKIIPDPLTRLLRLRSVRRPNCSSPQSA